ncbi:MAG: RIP metalloprotease RseP [Patescibacteria group bacterium]
MLVTIIAFFVILGVLVFVHEMGHFLVAKKTKTKAEEFGFGYPPRLFGWSKINGKRKFFWGNKDVESEDTIYSVNIWPLGGFVKIKGENGDGVIEDDSFASKSARKRIAILAAGVIMNVIFAMILLMINFGIGIPTAIESGTDETFVKNPIVQVVAVTKDSPADKAGIKLGDEVLAVNGQEIKQAEEIAKIVTEAGNQELTIKVKQAGSEKEVTLTPVLDESLGSEYVDPENPGRYVVGLSTYKVGLVSYPWYLAIWKGFQTTFILLWRILEAFGIIIGNLILGKGMLAEVSGPIGVAVMTGQMVSLGISHLLQFTALLSLNLAIVNILPFPALDGGRIVMILVEKIRGKKIDATIENVMHNIGFALLMLLIVLVTYRDLVNFGGGIWQAVKGVI